MAPEDGTPSSGSASNPDSPELDEGAVVVPEPPLLRPIPPLPDPSVDAQFVWGNGGEWARHMACSIVSAHWYAWAPVRSPWTPEPNNGLVNTLADDEHRYPHRLVLQPGDHDRVRVQFSDERPGMWGNYTIQLSPGIRLVQGNLSAAPPADGRRSHNQTLEIEIAFDAPGTYFVAAFAEARTVFTDYCPLEYYVSNGTSPPLPALPQPEVDKGLAGPLQHGGAGATCSVLTARWHAWQPVAHPWRALTATQVEGQEPPPALLRPGDHDRARVTFWFPAGENVSAIRLNGNVHFIADAQWMVSPAAGGPPYANGSAPLSFGPERESDRRVITPPGDGVAFPAGPLMVTLEIELVFPYRGDIELDFAFEDRHTGHIGVCGRVPFQAR